MAHGVTYEVIHWYVLLFMRNVMAHSMQYVMGCPTTKNLPWHVPWTFLVYHHGISHGVCIQ